MHIAPTQWKPAIIDKGQRLIIIIIIIIITLLHNASHNEVAKTYPVRLIYRLTIILQKEIFAEHVHVAFVITTLMKLRLS